MPPAPSVNLRELHQSFLQPIQLRPEAVHSDVVSHRFHWSDAEEAAASLATRPSDHHFLWALALLPLVPTKVLEPIFRLRGRTVVYRSATRLAEAGLIDAILPPVSAGSSSRLYYLTDLGLAALALHRRVDVAELARRYHLRGADLVSLLPGLPYLMATYDLLAALADSGSVWPSWVGWRRPWRCRLQPLTARTPIPLSLPAYAAFSLDGETRHYCLLPDVGDVPIQAYRPTLGYLYALQRVEQSRGCDIPTLLVATPGRARAAEWTELLEELERAQNTYPLPTYVTPRYELPTTDPALFRIFRPVSTERMQRPIQVPRLRPRRSSSPIPRPVGPALIPLTRPTLAHGRGRVAMGLTPSDRELLTLVGKHPFLTLQRLAVVLGWQVDKVRRWRNRMTEQGLMRLVAADEIGAEARLELVELTIEGMEILAAQQGLSFTQAVLYHGLTGGGPERSVGPRPKMLANLAHTLGTDALFVDLYQQARACAEDGGDDAVLEWQNSTACTRRHFRPDGFGRYRRDGYLYPFYIEYDRSTMGPKGLAHKFAAYYAYWNRQKSSHLYYRFPIVLFVTTTNTAEARIDHAACRAAFGQVTLLPILLTTEWRINDPSNPQGLLGPIWRELVADFEKRRYWLPAPESDLSEP